MSRSHKPCTFLPSFKSRVRKNAYLAGLLEPYCIRSVLPRPRVNNLQYGPRARLLRGYYPSIVYEEN